MKKILLFVVFIGISIISFGQNIQYFNKLLFPFSGTNNIEACVKIDSNYYLFGANLDTPFYYAGVQAFELIKIDQCGNILAKKMWLDSTNNYCYGNFYPGCMIATKSNKLLAWGGILDSNGVSYGLLICFNQSLDTLWTKVFTHPDTLAASQIGANVFNTFTAVRQTYDGGFIILGNYNPSCNSTYNNMYLLKTDSLGNFEWIKKFSNTDYSFDIEITSDSGFIFPSVPNYGMDLIKTDKNGIYQWTMHYDNNFKHRIGHDIEIINDSLIVIGSQYIYLDDYAYGYPNALDLANINYKTKQLIWERKHFVYGNLKSIDLHQSIKLKKQANGDLIVVGTAWVGNPNDSSEFNFKGIIMKLNSSADSLWTRFYGNGDFEDDCQFNDILLTDDGGFLAVGYHYAYHPGIMYQDAWVVKMDSFGCDTPGCQYVGVENSKSIVTSCRIYPNPASTKITIEAIGNQNLPYGILQIFDVFGKLVREEIIPKNEMNFELNISDLSEGLYMGRFVGNERENWSFKFVKE